MPLWETTQYIRQANREQKKVWYKTWTYKALKNCLEVGWWNIGDLYVFLYYIYSPPNFFPSFAFPLGKKMSETSAMLLFSLHRNRHNTEEIVCAYYQKGHWKRNERIVARPRISHKIVTVCCSKAWWSAVAVMLLLSCFGKKLY